MKNYFNFSKKESIGVLVLSAIIVILTVVLNVGNVVYVPDPLDIDRSKLEFLVLNNEEEKGEQNYANTNSNSSNSNYKTPIITDFDPNTIDLKKWMSFGFSEKQAQSILNYKNNYGPFKKKGDIKKLYVVSDEKYKELEPHIILTSQPIETENSSYSYEYEKEEEEEIPQFDINIATKDELISIKWIGPYFADKIILQREKIGGFIEFEQLKDPKLNLSDEAYKALLTATTISIDNIEKKNINTLSKNQLKKIPYSNWLIIAKILKERDKGQLENLDFLSEEDISPSDKDKFLKYLRFN